MPSTVEGDSSTASRHSRNPHIGGTPRLEPKGNVVIAMWEFRFSCRLYRIQYTCKFFRLQHPWWYPILWKAEKHEYRSNTPSSISEFLLLKAQPLRLDWIEWLEFLYYSSMWNTHSTTTSWVYAGLKIMHQPATYISIAIVELDKENKARKLDASQHCRPAI